jgi:NitT/TauT family transport system substrate-binding protein
MRVMETYQKVPACDIVCFAEVVTRDPFLLMGREPRPDFTLADLRSARLATVSEVPTPWLCLQHDLRLAGIDPASLARVADQTMARNVAALKAGEVDVIQVFEPFPSQLSAEGAAHVWYEAALRGPTSYTTFYARRYKALGIWSDTPVLPRAGYDRLRDGLVSGGFVSPGATFETAVDNTLAASVAAEQLPPLD